ncbi:MAG: hypothetical protein EAX90_11640 [Candidatus Heimdallarchaeota archaeon]|nr:hypothetical protein [Candidatus Heimdallarchaeota archaeon]
MIIRDVITQNYHFILVSCDSPKEREGMSELWHVLIEYCHIQPVEVFDLAIRGLFLIAINESSGEIVLKLKEIKEKEIFEFIICKKFTPLERIIESSLDLLVEIIPEYLNKIPEKASWRITLNRRHSKLSRTKIIETIVNLPNAPKGKVDLEKPEWEVIVELFGKWIGVAVYPEKSII